MKKVHSLNTAGIAHFTAWISNPVTPPPFFLLDDSDFSDELAKTFFVNPAIEFKNSYELGKYLHEEVFIDVADPNSLTIENGMWAWLSLMFIHNLLSRDRSRAGRPLNVTHYLQLDGQQGRRLSYRLITRTAWRLVRLHGEMALVALGSKRSPWGELAEQLTSRQQVFSHPSFWSVAFRLYLNSKGEARRGATSQRPAIARKDPKNNTGKGGVRRLPETFRQFDRTYLTRSMSADQMLEFLPSEYQKWKAK